MLESSLLELQQWQNTDGGGVDSDFVLRCARSTWKLLLQAWSTSVLNARIC